MDSQVASKNSSSFPVRMLKQQMLSAEDLNHIQDFTQDLDQALVDIAEASRKNQELNKEVKELKSSLESRGWFGSLKAGLSGKTDKELALMVESLGAGLTVTQNVVRVILKVMTQKNRVLHGFNQALVDKITAVTKDTVTLDQNQRLVAREFLGSLQRQVAEQIRQMELVDEHDMKLIEFDGWRAEKDETDATFGQQLVELTGVVDTFREQVQADTVAAQSRLAGLDNRVISFKQEADSHQAAFSQALDGVLAHLSSLDETLLSHAQWRDAKNHSDIHLAARVEGVEVRSDALEAASVRHQSLIAGQAELLEKQAAQITVLQDGERALQGRLDALQARVAQLEELEGQSHGVKARLLRYAPPVIAGGLACAALYQSLI